MKTRQQMVDLGYAPDAGPAVMYFLTSHFSDKEVADIQKLIPRKDLVEAWRDIEDHAKELAKRLMGKEAATPSRTWQLLSSARPEMVLFLAVTAKQQSVEAEDQELPHQVASGAAEDSVARNDGVADHAAVAELPETRARRVHAPARWQTALAHRNAEIPEAIRAAAAAATASAPSGTRRQSRRRSRSCTPLQRRCKPGPKGKKGKALQWLPATGRARAQG